MEDCERRGCSQYGADMGRRGQTIPRDTAAQLRVIRVHLDNGGYDPGGAYWGGEQPLYCVTDAESDLTEYFRADDQRIVRSYFPKAQWAKLAQRRDKRGLILGLDDFTRAYMEAALWSSTDQTTEDGGRPLDENFGVSGFTVRSLKGAIRDCKAFQAEQAANLDTGTASRGGHDFWLTRNGHGAGFWDGDWEPKVGRELTKASKAYGSVDLYVWRGRIHGHE